jgi:hypothetical protein
MRKPAWCLATLFVAVLGACTLPGHSGWECDGNGDCSSGLECRSVHSDREGYSSACLAPGETVVVGSKGNWLHLLMWPVIGLCLGGAVIGRILVARADRARVESRKTRFRRR